MARRESTSTLGSGRSRRVEAKVRGSSQRRAAQTGIPVGEHGSVKPEKGGPARSIECVIENERVRLGRAQSILKCLHTALSLVEERNDSEPGYAEVVDVALRLIRESVHRLDSVYVKPLLERLKKTSSRATRPISTAHK